MSQPPQQLGSYAKVGWLHSVPADIVLPFHGIRNKDAFFIPKILKMFGCSSKSVLFGTTWY
jgi:hypothetical protein